jgi:hypothetical protein
MNFLSSLNQSLFLFSKWLFLIICLFSLQQSIGQKLSLEINSYIDWNTYPPFVKSFNSTSTSTIKMKGINWNVGINYKHAINRNILIKMGVGYQKYSFNDIKESTNSFSRDARVINYPEGISTFGYVTNKYWYNNISANIGIEKLLKFQKGLDFITGLEVVNYYTFSQRYNIPASNKIYKTTDNRYLGLSSYLYTGLQRTISKNISFMPTIRLPIFMLWKQDDVFPYETNSLHRSKWLRGVGFGVTCVYQRAKTAKL